MKSIIVKAKKLPVGTVRKYGQSFYKKTASRGWQRVPTKEGRKLYEKQEGKKTKFTPTSQNLIFAFEDLKPPLPLSNLGARKYLIEKGYIKKVKNGFERTNKGTEKYLELKRGKKERRSKQLAKEYRDHEKTVIGVIKQQQEKIDKEKKTGIKVYKDIYYFNDRANAKQWATKNKWPIDRIISYKRGWTIQSGKSGNYAGPGVKPKQWEGTIKKPLKQKAKTPIKQPTRTKKTPTRINVSNVTQQYIDKLKKIKIMNKSGKRVYIKLIKRAIKNKDRKLLDQYLKEIDNWIKRDKKLKEGKKKKMDWRAVK